jgi:hypothetical protein
MAKIPLRFSLATLLLLATVVCLGIALWASARRLEQVKDELKQFREEIRQYRDELGYPTIQDPENLHVIRMPLEGELQWQWRVYVPEADRFGVTVATGEIPKEGIGGCQGLTAPLRAGVSVIHASIIRDYRGVLVFRIERKGGSFKTELTGEHADWLNSPGWNTVVAGSNGTEMADAGQPLVLLRFRAAEEIEIDNEDGTKSTGWRESDEPTMGLMAWITDSKGNQ